MSGATRVAARCSARSVDEVPQRGVGGQERLPVVRRRRGHQLVGAGARRPGRRACRRTVAGDPATARSSDASTRCAHLGATRPGRGSRRPAPAAGTRRSAATRAIAHASGQRQLAGRRVVVGDRHVERDRDVRVGGLLARAEVAAVGARAPSSPVGVRGSGRRRRPAGRGVRRSRGRVRSRAATSGRIRGATRVGRDGARRRRAGRAARRGRPRTCRARRGRGAAPRVRAAVKPSDRPTPRSTRPGCSASSIRNCSATTSGWWLGSMTPPEPSRMRSVRGADRGQQHRPATRSRCPGRRGARRPRTGRSRAARPRRPARSSPSAPRPRDVRRGCATGRAGRASCPVSTVPATCPMPSRSGSVRPGLHRPPTMPMRVTVQR